MSPIDAFSNLQHNINANLLVANDSVAHNASTLRTNEHMSPGKKLFLNIITFGIAGHFIDKHEREEDERLMKQCAQDIITLKSKLEGLHDGSEQGFAIPMGDVVGEIHQDSGNRLTAIIDGETVSSPFTAAELVENIENDMVDNIDFYGRKAVCELIESKRDVRADIGTTPTRDRQLCLQVMAKIADMDETQFANTPTSLLHTFALNALNAKKFNPATLQAFQANIANAHHIASEDAQGLLEQLTDAMQTDGMGVQNKVNLDALRPPVNILVGADGQSQDHITTWHDVHNLAADLVCNNDSQIYDANLDEAGKRVQDTFAEHAGTIADIIKHRELLSTLPDEIREPIAQVISEFETQVHDLTGQDLGFVTPELVRTAIAHVPAATYADCEAQIEAFVQKASSHVQDTVNQEFGRIFSPEDETPTTTPAENTAATPTARIISAPAGATSAAPADAPAATQPRLTPAQTVAAGQYQPPARADKTPTDINFESKALDEMLRENSGAKSGQGKFMAAVFSKYFDHMSSIDQRNMIASSIRYATAQDSSGAQLGALLKGAGPIMQKMLQGFDTTHMDPEMKTALGDMKDSLASIHPRVISAHLLDMVEKSHGEIQKITVNRSLGAASVGQAFLCTMTLADGSEKECVIKILRPDVQNRAFREQALFTEAAKQVPGMEVTFAGQLGRIMEELDLRLEARNVETGQIYNGAAGCEALESMKLNPLVEPTANTMVIDKAPGSTLAGYMRDVQAQIDAMPSGEQDVPVETILERNQRLEDLYADVKKRQEHLASLSSAWVEEGIFGEGFYHGDLHAGNIMTDPEKMTVIDFGNATSLTKEQQGSVTRMMCGASVGDSKIFLKAYQELLSPEGREIFHNNEAKIQETVAQVMSLGGASQTGQRIGVILTKLQNMGIELPAPIYNFSQCQLRLQSALDGMNALMQNIQQALKKTGSPTNSNVQPFYFINYDIVSTLTTNLDASYMHEAVAKGRDRLDKDKLQAFSQVLQGALPEHADKLRPPERLPTMIPLFDDCVRTCGTPQFEEAVQAANDELLRLAYAELDAIEAAIPKMTQKWPPRDFCSCMSDVISNHLQTIISQLGFADSIRMHWMRV